MAGRDHALLSASSAERWINCPASVRLSERLTDTTSTYAEEGTLAHEIAELGLRLYAGEISKRAHGQRLKKLKEHELFYEGMLDEVTDYVDFCIESHHAMLAEDPHTEMMIEHRLDYAKYAPSGFGTGDCVIVGAGKVHVIDLKFGKGVVVDPVENAQLRLYGLGAYDEMDFLYDIQSVTVTVAQVRLGNIVSWTTSAEELLHWAESVVRPAAELAFRGGSKPVPGDHCRWCPRRVDCRARAEHKLELYERYKEEQKETLSLEEMAHILAHTKEIAKWAKEMEEYALQQALEGVSYPGWKVVEGRSNRCIPAERVDEFAQTLLSEGYEESEIYKPKALESITALEKLVGKGRFAELGEGILIKPEGKPVLVADTDKRPALLGVESEFEFK